MKKQLKEKRWGLTKNYKRLLSLLFLFAFLFVIAIRIINQDLFYVSLDHLYEYKTKLAEEEIYIGELRKQLEITRKELSNHKDLSFLGKEKKLKFQNEIEKFKQLAGFSSVQGEGVIVVVDDGLRELIEEEDPLNIIVHDVDVNHLINELNSAGAEAISINGNRILMGISEIKCNGPTIRINGIQQSRPYVIKAIGDKYKLSEVLLNNNSYGINLLKYGIQYEVVTSTKLQIGAYRGTKSYTHAVVMED